jgi:hypothetical protein
LSFAWSSLWRYRCRSRVNLSGINQVAALAPAEIQGIPFAAIQREPGGRRFPLRAGFLD